MKSGSVKVIAHPQHVLAYPSITPIDRGIGHMVEVVTGRKIPREMSNPTCLYPHSEEGRKGLEVLIERYDLTDFSSGPTPSSRSLWRQQGNVGFEDR